LKRRGDEMTSYGDELRRRFATWNEVITMDREDLDPRFLRARGIYGGAQGIWVDKANTASVSQDGRGVTVSILHTGRHYADELSDDGLIYHYPRTGRPPGRDAAEVQATKNAAELGIPIFIILPGRSNKSKRCVQFGWVADFDDESGQFLVLFGSDRPKYERPSDLDSPFQLVTKSTVTRTMAKARPGQQRFRFQVIAQYGCKCAVCSITHGRLTKAAHICGKEQHGSDDWRNGIPLCSTHHDAFDAHLFAIQPETLAIVTMPGVTPESIGITTDVLAPLRRRPHPDAVKWRFEQTEKIWVDNHQE
jgi:putative restriction endonuclease